MLIRTALAEDAAAIASLLDAAFGRAAERGLVVDLRAAGAVVAETVAQNRDGCILGHALMSWLLAPAGWLVLVLAPVAPGHQRRGIGGAVVRACLQAGRGAGGRAAVVVGDPRYYARFGFSLAGAARLENPYPPEYTSLLCLAGAPLTAAEAVAGMVFPAAFAGL